MNVTMNQKNNDDGLERAIQEQYGNQLTEQEAAENARNLVGLFEVLLEVHQQQEAKHD